MKTIKASLAVFRTKYAYALLAEDDLYKAVDIKDAFEKTAEKYPYTGEEHSEEELMQFAKEIHKERKEE